MDPMAPISAPARDRDPKIALRPLVTGSILACLCLLALGFGGSLAADDEKQDKSAQSSQAGAKASATPGPSPSPAPGGSAKPSAVTAKSAGSAARPASAAPSQKPALRFDDFDLEKYHKPAPKEEEEEEVIEEPDTGPAASVAPGTDTKGVMAPRPRPKVRPRPTPVEPAADPLKAFRDREAMDKFRQSQIESGRLRIAKLQDRLNYLNAKKDALNNPAPMLVGQTQVQNPPKPGEAPAPPTPIQGPGRGITAKPGTGTVPVMGLFPPIPPPQTDEDKENDKKLKVKDLLLQVEEEIKSVQEELETAKDELAAVETRFAGSPSR